MEFLLECYTLYVREWDNKSPQRLRTNESYLQLELCTRGSCLQEYSTFWNPSRVNASVVAVRRLFRARIYCFFDEGKGKTADGSHYSDIELYTYRRRLHKFTTCVLSIYLVLYDNKICLKCIHVTYWNTIVKNV